MLHILLRYELNRFRNHFRLSVSGFIQEKSSIITWRGFGRLFVLAEAKAALNSIMVSGPLSNKCLRYLEHCPAAQLNWDVSFIGKGCPENEYIVVASVLPFRRYMLLLAISHTLAAKAVCLSMKLPRQLKFQNGH